MSMSKELNFLICRSLSVELGGCIILEQALWLLKNNSLNNKPSKFGGGARLLAHPTYKAQKIQLLIAH